MIPAELRAKWDRDCDRREIIFLADHGGGWPDVLQPPELSPEERLDILRGLGFRVAEHYEMEASDPDKDEMWPWVHLTNSVAVCLQDGFVSRAGGRLPKRKGGRKHGGA